MLKPAQIAKDAGVGKRDYTTRNGRASNAGAPAEAEIWDGCLEVELQSKLNFARLARPRWFPEISIGVARIGTHKAVCFRIKRDSVDIESSVDIQELGMVQRIVKLCPELDGHTLPRQGEVPIQRQVKVVYARSSGHTFR